MNRTITLSLLVLSAVILTVLTQVGGAILVLSWIVSKRVKLSWKGKFLSVFIVLYSFISFLTVPVLATWFGRERIVNTDCIQASSFMTLVMNRNYVRSGLNELLQRTAGQLKDQNIEVRYLDASFPFFDGFPLLPHLSHYDGKKLDLSLVYETVEGEVTSLSKSRSGYGVFEGPRRSEFDQVNQCLEKGYFQYDYPKYLTFGSINEDLSFSSKGTKSLINALLKEPSLQKLFIEPHLKQRLGLTNPKIRYHGCRAVRHDDHIHIQVK